MEQVQVTVTLNADDIEFLESWQLVMADTGKPLSLAQKVRECIYDKRERILAAQEDDYVPF